MLIALDTETTGADFYHGARPFLVTICDDTGSNTFWEWPVDPKTRKPAIPKADIKAITDILLDPSNTFVLHNARFDCAALNSILLPLQRKPEWIEQGYFPWSRTEDTLVASHVLGSALPHGLDACAVQYLGYRKMGLYETRIELATKKARDYVRRFLPTWRIAKHGLPDMPSIKESANTKDKTGQNRDAAWKNDMWLLKTLLEYDNHPVERLEMIAQYQREWTAQYDTNGSPIPGSTGDGLCADYANLDSAITHRLWPVLKQELHRRDLWGQYKDRMKLLPIAYRMERNGLTLSETRLTELINTFAKGVSDNHEICLRIAREMGYPLTMPKGSSNNRSLTTFLFGEATISCSRCNKRIVITREQAHRQHGKTGICKHCKQQSTAIRSEWPWLDLPAIKHTESGNASIDKEAMEQYIKVEELTDTQRQFLIALQTSRSQSKAVEALSGYNAFWLQVLIPFDPNEDDGSYYTNWRLIHPNLNPTGTDTLRWSCRNPNLQNISKKEEFNLRYPFGPSPGREHWSFDFRNIEKRLPAYECGEQTFIDLFEKANQPPYYGSDHILKFSVIYPHLWEKALKEHGPEHAAEWIKSPEGYKATYYQWIKNTNFALQYECGEAKADATAHAKGVKKLLSGSFPKEAAMKRYWISYANRHGYVETMPRKSVNPNRGYPLMCTRSASGTVSPTIPLAYHISGTAMDLTAAAMIVCQQQLDTWNRECGIPEHYRMCLQVHDELFFDWPKAADPQKNPRRSNLARARIIQRLMESCGNDLICRRLDGTTVTVPTPVSVEYHPTSWEKGVAL